MNQTIGNSGKQGWNGSGSDDQNTNNIQKLSQTEKLNQHEDRKKKYQEFYGKKQNSAGGRQIQGKVETPNQSNSETITLPTNPQKFLHVEPSNYTRRQEGNTVFIESKERYGGNGSPVEGYVFSASAKERGEGNLTANINTNQEPNHTRYLTQESSIAGSSRGEKREHRKGEVVESQAKLASRRVGEVNRSLPADKTGSASVNKSQSIPVNSQGGEAKESSTATQARNQNQSQLDKPHPSTEIKNQPLQPYFMENNHCLFLGDCVEVMKQFPDNYVDMIFADPPYFLSEPDEKREVTNFPIKDLKFKQGDKEGSFDNYKGEWDVSKGFRSNLQFHHAWIKEARRILKPEGTIWVTGTHHSIYQCGFCLQNQQFKILNEISWYKPRSKYNPKKYFNFSHETIIWARKSKGKEHKHHFNENLMSRWRGDPLKDSNPENSQSMRTVWQIDPPSKKETIHGRHPTQKPIQLLQRIILASTKPDAIILDPFNGSGTTGVAVESINQGLQKSKSWDGKTQRKYIGIDREEEYLEVSRRRLKDSGNRRNNAQ